MTDGHVSIERHAKKHLNLSIQMSRRMILSRAVLDGKCNLVV